ncbi:MAG: hypothetical protein FWH03_07940 [Firmicutes bacterium]|nr:hypothetical protein [Bacillota bacterium]
MKTIKKWCLVLVLLMLSVAVFSACEKDGPKINPKDALILTVSVDKDELGLGDTVQVTVTLENISDKRIDMWDYLWGWGGQSLPANPLDRIVETALIPTGKDTNGTTWSGLGGRIVPNVHPDDPYWRNFTMPAGARYSRTDSFTIDDSMLWWEHFELENSDTEYYLVQAYICFYSERKQTDLMTMLWATQEITRII